MMMPRVIALHSRTWVTEGPRLFLHNSVVFSRLHDHSISVRSTSTVGWIRHQEDGFFVRPSVLMISFSVASCPLSIWLLSMIFIRICSCLFSSTTLALQLEASVHIHIVSRLYAIVLGVILNSVPNQKTSKQKRSVRIYISCQKEIPRITSTNELWQPIICLCKIDLCNGYLIR